MYNGIEKKHRKKEKNKIRRRGSTYNKQKQKKTQKHTIMYTKQIIL